MSNPTDEKETAPKELPPSSETIVRNSGSGKFFVKFGYLYLIVLNLLVLFYDDVPISLQILSVSAGCIIVGSFSSLRHPESAEAQEVERLKPKDAYMFPIFGSIALCSFYVAIKYLPGYVVDVAAQSFFILMSAFASQALFEELAAQFFPSPIYQIFDVQMFILTLRWKVVFKVPMVADKNIYVPIPSITSINSEQSNNGNQNQEVHKVLLLNIITLILGCIVAYLWFAWDQYWLFNNMIGISLSIQAISFLNPGSYYTATVLLGLLFFYDIFWVFGTDVMVTVAKNLKAPIKLIFPRPSISEKPNMLGLGDIVLPGIYIALLLRYDVQQTFKNIDFKNITQKGLSTINLPKLNINTFYISLLCYLASLTTCLVFMWVFDAPQPALLYIVPGVIIPILLMATIRGDVNTLWTYDEEPDQQKKKRLISNALTK